jgi:hypothetical protein
LEEEQCGFRKGRGCTDATFRIQQLLEKRKEFNLPIFLLLTDYEKAYDNLNRNLLWKILHVDKIPPQLIKAIQNLYKETKFFIKFTDRNCSEPLTINKGVRQDCGLSPIRFNIYVYI